MSDILIKSVEMPTKGYRLILIHADGTVQTTDGETTAISVPPHGRLIDADTIGLTNFEIMLCKQEHEPYKEALKMVLDKIEKSPTIILEDRREAEE